METYHGLSCIHRNGGDSVDFIAIDRRYSTESPVPTDSSLDTGDENSKISSKVNSTHISRKRMGKVNRQRRLDHESRRCKRITGTDGSCTQTTICSCGGSDSSRLSFKSSNSSEDGSTTTIVKEIKDSNDSLNRCVDDENDWKEVLHYGGYKSSTEQSNKKGHQSQLVVISPLPASYSEKIADVAPPNQCPFNIEHKSTKKDEAENKNADVLANVKSFEAVGPPNVTLPLCDSSTIFKSRTSEEFNHESHDSTNNFTQSKEPPTNQKHGESFNDEFPDQFDFIKEQASILCGRPNDTQPPPHHDNADCTKINNHRNSSILIPDYQQHFYSSHNSWQRNANLPFDNRMSNSYSLYDFPYAEFHQPTYYHPTHLSPGFRSSSVQNPYDMFRPAVTNRNASQQFEYFTSPALFQYQTHQQSPLEITKSPFRQTYGHLTPK